ncbi:MOSC domain-containing protein [Hyphomicrobiales bacterium]|uniref:MOSC domain-containing protein n=1 Tax=Pseudochrobactrum asaccharolyticum TaxID=354351 RepID=UPI000EFCB2E4
MTVIDTILTGSIAPLGPRAAPSAINKLPSTGKNWLGSEGFIKDAQGDRKNHGGPEKAVHHYAYDHYDGWKQEIGERIILNHAGAFGENLSTTGLTEETVAIGDVFQAGDAVIQVSQGRQPCWKLNIRFDTGDMALRVQRSGRTGWYYRVLQEGNVQAGDTLQRIERPSPEWTIRKAWHLLYVDTMNLAELAVMAELEHLAQNWRDYAIKRLASRKVEDWSRRLQG